MNNVLLCATDAGGARNLAPLLKVIKKRGYQPVLVTPKYMTGLFDSQYVKLIDSSHIEISSGSVKKLVDSVKPTAIICGTTRYISIDRLLISEGKKKSIQTVVVLDEWFNHRLRFENEKGELEFLPDAIACMDEKAKKGAIEEGIPEGLCFITGSPSLTDLTNRAEGFVKKPCPMPDFLKIKKPTPILTFLSQPFTKDYGSKKGEHGSLGSFIGYTEETVKNDIKNVVKKINKPCIIVEKLHPSSELDDHSYSINENIKWIRIKKTNLWSLYWHSQAVIGMRSMAILESAIFNRPTISYQPGLLVKDTCTAVVFGLVKKLSTPIGLEKWLNNQFNKSVGKDKRSINRYPFAREDSIDNVVSLAI
jgi:hypothetical protein